MNLIPSRVLIVDDETQLLELIEGILEDLPIDITTALSGEEGMEIIKSSKEFAVTISNFHMGKGMNGGDFLKFVGSYCPNTIRILMTGGLDQDSLIKGRKEGKYDSFSLKPIVLHNFVNQVESCVNEYNTK